MLRVLLVQPPHRDTFGYSMPPLGPLHLGAAARARGHEVRFDDLALALRRGQLPTDDSLASVCAERLLADEPDVVGLGAMISSMPMALELVAELHRRRPELPVILGGQGPETVEEAVIERHPGIDAVAVGEAEQSFVAWLAVVESQGVDSPAMRDVAGLVVRCDGAPLRTPSRPVLPDLDALPPIAWDLAESPRAYAAAAGGGEALFPLDLGRGCSFACCFCTTSVFWGRKARQLSPARAADAFFRLAALDGLDTIYVTHDLFTADRERVLAICAELVRRGNRTPWECRTRLDLVDEQLLSALKAAGCRRILYGVESDSPAVLASVNKGGLAATQDVRAQLELASRVGMASILGLMVGIPGERPEDVEANLQLAVDAAVLDGVSLSLHWFNVTPGNGQTPAAGNDLSLIPGVHADLVRGHDLSVGRVPTAQAQLIRDDPEVFAAFRVFTPGHSTPEALSLLTRNAHLMLEVLPRTARALARARGESLRQTLDAFLAQLHRATEAAACWEEPYLLSREAAVKRFAAHALAHGDPGITALARYERALFETTSAHVVHFEVDPLPLLAAHRPADRQGDDSAHLVDHTDRDTPLNPAHHGPRAILFTRHGDLVRAAGLSEFLAHAAEEPDDATLLADWPDADAAHVARARRALNRLTHSVQEASRP